MAELGAPIAAEDAKRLMELTKDGDAAAVAAAEKILDRYTLVRLSVDADGTLKAGAGGAPRVLVEQAWRLFLLRVENFSEETNSVSLLSSALSTPGRMARDSSSFAQSPDLMDTVNKAPLIEKLWFLAEVHDTTRAVYLGRLVPVFVLSGAPVEYRVVQLYSRDQGDRTADISFANLKEGKPIAVASTKFNFTCRPTRDVDLVIKDDDGQGCMASLVIRDSAGHVYPPQAMRIAPDMFFHAQIYRADGETIRLPDGHYIVESWRGPEYIKQKQAVKIDGEHAQIKVQLKRWIDPARWGWYSGDAHIHNAGCAHYQVPTAGVAPETMIRHVRGEGLSIGASLNWGPSWYYQKQFFTGQAVSPAANLEHPDLQAANSVTWQPKPTPKDGESMLRYDVEVSGFPSSLSGHLILMNLKAQDYPGTKSIEDWPSWNLPILRWAKADGATVGFAHCASGMVVNSTGLPNYEIPSFDAIGTNEAIVDVTYGVVDFLSGCNKHPVAELNAWYHMLNCGYRLAMVGETDYPCVTGERPGVGRTYVHLDVRPTDDAGYQKWVRGMQQGHLYCGDGRSHFLDFNVQGQSSGSEVAISHPVEASVNATVAAWLEPQPTPETEEIRKTKGMGPARWNIENARIGDTREVPVELIVNGVAVDRVNLMADGAPRKIQFKTKIERSSWIALRILPSGHTYPVYVTVDGKPIRASSRSAQWLRACVDKLWEVKRPFMRVSERAAAAEAYDHARKTYETILRECEADK